MVRALLVLVFGTAIGFLTLAFVGGMKSPFVEHVIVERDASYRVVQTLQLRVPINYRGNPRRMPPTTVEVKRGQIARYSFVNKPGTFNWFAWAYAEELAFRLSYSHRYGALFRNPDHLKRAGIPRGLHYARTTPDTAVTRPHPVRKPIPDYPEDWVNPALMPRNIRQGPTVFPDLGLPVGFPMISVNSGAMGGNWYVRGVGLYGPRGYIRFLEGGRIVVYPNLDFANLEGWTKNRGGFTVLLELLEKK